MNPPRTERRATVGGGLLFTHGKHGSGETRIPVYGEFHEQIYNVPVSEGRRVARDGSVEPVGSTVDVADASYTNTIGDAQFMTFWQDPDFDTEEPAFYYVRTLMPATFDKRGN